MFPKHKSKGMRPLTGKNIADEGWGAVNSSRSEKSDLRNDLQCKEGEISNLQIHWRIY